MNGRGEGTSPARCSRSRWKFRSRPGSGSRRNAALTLECSPARRTTRWGDDRRRDSGSLSTGDAIGEFAPSVQPGTCPGVRRSPRRDSGAVRSSNRFGTDSVNDGVCVREQVPCQAPRCGLPKRFFVGRPAFIAAAVAAVSTRYPGVYGTNVPPRCLCCGRRIGAGHHQPRP